MEKEPSLLTEEEAAEFAGVNTPTIVRYTEAGFLTPSDRLEDGSNLYSEEELIQVFELSPKSAAVRRAAATKKRVGKKATVLTEKDRLIAEKDLQIRDLKDQREWLRTRVEKLEAELRDIATPTQAEVETYSLTVPSITVNTTTVNTTPVNTTAEKPSTLKKLLAYFGFIEKNEIEEPQPSIEATNEKDHTDAKSTPITSENTSPSITHQIEPDLAKPDLTQRGARPFRRSANDSQELLDLLGTPNRADTQNSSPDPEPVTRDTKHVYPSQMKVSEMKVSEK